MNPILLSSDYKTVYLNFEENPNIFGEALRNYCFIGNCNQLGCYSTFQMLNIFKKVKRGKIYQEAQKYLYEDIVPTVYYYKLEEKDCWVKDGNNLYKIDEPYEIVVGWAWDGDGCLYIRYNNRIVINNDCKCDYTWKWIQE